MSRSRLRDSRDQEPRGNVSICLAITLAGLMIVNGGCEFSLFPGKSLAAPVSESLPYEIESGRRFRGHSGDRFELKDRGVIHYILLNGIDAPNEDQPFFDQARNKLSSLLSGKKLRVQIVGRDDFTREIGSVFVEGVDVNLKMIEAGMARYDGSDFKDAEIYRQAEQKSRASKLGIWAHENPDRAPKSEPVGTSH